MNFKDKNTVVLAISAALIVLAIIIAVTATIVEHKKSNNESTKAPNEIVAENKEDNKKPNEAEKDTAKAPESTTASTTAKPAPQNTGDSKVGKYKVATKDDPLGVRVTPKQNASRVTEAAKGSEIEVLAVYGEWGYVEVDGVNGWVAMKYLEFVSASENAPKHNAGKYKIATKDDPLGIRTKPMDDASRDGEVPKGKVVEVLAVCGDWGYVEYEGKQGWLSFNYLEAA